MARLTGLFSVAIYALLHSTMFASWTTAYSCTNETSINGHPFPDLIEVTLEDLIGGLESDLFTSVDLVNAYVARINEVNATLHMVTELNPDALSIAASLDAERANGTNRGPLHGIPILIKGNIGTLDKLNTTAGSYALLGAELPEDSTIAAKLRKAGAIILGKTNLSQWANFRSSNTTNGWSAYGGQTYAAYYPEQDPSGSSSGSGVASSLGLSLAALGTETSGSIVSPSEVNNLVGIKPTVGLTSRFLVVPISEHQDTIGPMARTVKDAAYLLQSIAGMDPNDNYTSAIPFNGSLPDYVAACNFSALSGKRIGVPRNAISVFNDTVAIVDAFNTALKLMEAAGATIVENTNFTAYEEYENGNSSTIVLEVDFLSDLPKEFLSKLTYNPTGVTDLNSTRYFTQHFPLEDYPDRNTYYWDQGIELGFDNTSPEFWSFYQENLRIGGPGGITGAIQNNSLDALVIPTYFAAGVPALIGSPIVTVPLGAYPSETGIEYNQRNSLVEVAPNIPFGISFLGERFSEETLIGLAYAYEQRTHTRDTIQPYIQPTIELADVVGNMTMKKMKRNN